MDFNVNGHPMGEIVYSNDENVKREISGKVVGTDAIEEVTIVKNGFNLHTFQGKGIETPVYYLDKTRLKKGDYYYLRVIQKDGEMAWSSPVWFETRHHTK